MNLSERWNVSKVEEEIGENAELPVSLHAGLGEVDSGLERRRC